MEGEWVIPALERPCLVMFLAATISCFKQTNIFAIVGSATLWSSLISSRVQLHIQPPERLKFGPHQGQLDLVSHVYSGRRRSYHSSATDCRFRWVASHILSSLLNLYTSRSPHGSKTCQKLKTSRPQRGYISRLGSASTFTGPNPANGFGLAVELCGWLTLRGNRDEL